ncbi:MAG: 2-isopropylmalate synthase, partial [Actinobacteria bacterium]|nr:2-isopropylmalate synthase [Actinomycetota bacterium]
VEYCNQLPVPERAPYGGDLVYTAFSGSHQDAIKKGFELMEKEADSKGVSVDDLIWSVPYLPIDPKDVGRSYEAVIRVNSQSGKGGVAYLLKSDHSLDLPRKLQIEFSRVVQNTTDEEGGEVSSEKLWNIFTDEYLPAAADDQKWGRFELRKIATNSDMDGTVKLDVVLRDGAGEVTKHGTGNGPISAFIDVLSQLGVQTRLLDYVEHTLSAGGDAQAASYIELEVGDRTLWGVGIDGDIATASLKALISSVNRSLR